MAAPDGLGALSEELLRRVLSRLGARAVPALLRCSEVSTPWRAGARDPALWRRLLAGRFPLARSPAACPVVNYATLHAEDARMRLAWPLTADQIEQPDQFLVPAASYVRAVRVGPHFTALGLFDGSVACFAVGYSDGSPDQPGAATVGGSGTAGLGHADETIAVAIHGGMILSGGGCPSHYNRPPTDGTVRLWLPKPVEQSSSLSLDVPTAWEEEPLVLEEHPAFSVRAIVVWDDLGFTGSDDGVIRVHRLTGWRERQVVSSELAVCEAAVWCLADDVSGGLWSGHADGVLRLWPVSEQSMASVQSQPVRQVRGDASVGSPPPPPHPRLYKFGARAVYYHARARQLVAGFRNGDVGYFVLGTEQRKLGEEHVMQCWPMHGAEVVSVRADGHKCVTIGRDGRMLISAGLGGAWSAEAFSFEPEGEQPAKQVCFQGLRMYASSVFFDGRLLVLDGFDNQVLYMQFS